MSEMPLPQRKREIPEKPAEITSITGSLSSDQKRVKVSIQLSDDSTRPDLELILEDMNKEEICRSTIIENFGDQINFTLHIRKSGFTQPYKLICKLSYDEDKVQSEKTVIVEQLA